ncbi:peptidase S8/S53 domain-containing protein [Podospora aff. communis PSN243]|uniref:tripeptidyl-peptidase II n=1 Tax=Podospora aff. communis PSN243 TaxID=3040156 RepID=A0AAV9H3X1_9PEZI|nr:peptidase S8/S53 domain-containing protein [Podospora aff. communis PSN243]
MFPLTHFVLLASVVPTGLGYLMGRTAVPPAISPATQSRQKRAPVNDNQVLHFHVGLGLDETRQDAAIRALLSVSDPDAPTYGRHWTATETAEFFAPPKHQIREVAQWLTGSGVPRKALRLSPDRTRLSFRTTAGVAKRLFDAPLYQHARRDGQLTTGAEGYSVPQHLANHIDCILPTYPRQILTNKTTSHMMARAATLVVDCFRYMSPQCIRELYNVEEAPAHDQPHPSSSLGVFTPSWQTYLPDDMDTFFADFAPHLIGKRPRLMAVNGGYRQTDYKLTPFNLEANLDYQYTMALAHPVPVVDIQVGDYTQIGTLNNMLGAFDSHYCDTALDANFDPIWPNPTSHPSNYNGSDCGRYTPPRVITIQHVGNEAEFSPAYARRQCLEFLKLGLQGVTVLAATGDRGTADQLGSCIDPLTGNYTGRVLFSSTFPASCPWVTSVGGTSFLPTPLSSSPPKYTPGSRNFPPESALNINNRTMSSGGFSRLFPAPWYQSHLTRSYLDSIPPIKPEHIKYFNPQGRGYPDISAHATNYLVSLYGTYRAVHGTSASTPVIAAMVARVNDERLRAGKRTLGFLNPVLYNPRHRAKIVREIEAGAVGGCGQVAAFPARKGWDAVTGLGVVDFGGLRTVGANLA